MSEAKRLLCIQNFLIRYVNSFNFTSAISLSLIAYTDIENAEQKYGKYGKLLTKNARLFYDEVKIIILRLSWVVESAVKR